MVTSNNLPDKKVVKMAEQNNSNNIVVPQRTLLGEVNEHITCPLCRGYYIDATTIVECLHSFCRSCIIKHLQVKSYCPVCEMMINSAKPNIKPDKALQDIVYKLVPGLFQREMERRQHFYASRPGTAAAATPEQRGEDTERIIFSPEDVISFSLEYADATDTDSISSKSSDSNESPVASTTSRRYLQCPAVVNISHLKKFISMKYDVDCSQFSIDILYKRVPLSDYYTLMDIAYIYNWKRNEPMRFFFQITDFIAIRTRYGLFDINQKESHFRDIKSSPTHTEDTSTSSPAPNLSEQVFEASSGFESATSDVIPGNVMAKKVEPPKCDTVKPDSSSQNTNLEEEKSQFLNSFELTAKSSQASIKQNTEKVETEKLTPNQNKSPNTADPKISDPSLKRKPFTLDSQEIKKPKLEDDANKPLTAIGLSDKNSSGSSISETNPIKSSITIGNKNSAKEIKIEPKNVESNQELISPKRPVPSAHCITPPKRKLSSIPQYQCSKTEASSKTISPLRIPIPKSETIPSNSKEKPKELHKATQKKIPDLKPSVPTAKLVTQNKLPTVGKLRMDLLANNSDPTIDRSKILSQVKTSLSAVNSTQGSAGDPLKSLFDSCKINIPSSLSITLTDQKLEQQSNNESTDNKGTQHKSSTSSNALNSQRVPSPPVHNYIEVIKLPDADPKSNPDAALSKPVNNLKIPNKPSEGSAKGPIPSLKPIADAKIPKVGGASPITFQQTFEQQLQSEKTKLPKSKLQVPKLMPATPKVLNAVNKLNMSKAIAGCQDIKTSLIKPDNVLDLSTSHSSQSPIDLQQSKKFDLHSILKKQASNSLPGSAFSASSVRPQSASSSSLRPPVAGTNNNPLKVDSLLLNATRQEATLKQNLSKSLIALPGAPSPNHNTPPPNPKVHTRSPSSSPKLVIAEEKHITNTEPNTSQSNQVSSSLISNPVTNKGESSNSPTPSTKQNSKPPKTTQSLAKPSGSSQSTPTPNKPMPSVSTSDFLSQPQLISAQHALLRHMEMQNAWLVKAQRQYDLFKNMSNISNHQQQNNKDKQ